jgi:glyoxylase-like metal-dependent hydrolase (beta-lactamase superfamily II)
MLQHDARSWFDITPLGDQLFGIAERRHCEEVLSFLMVGRNEATLIDSGMGLFSMKAAVQRLTVLPCQVLNTHSHFDHVGSNYEFQKVALFDHPDNRRAAQHGFSTEYLAKWGTETQFGGSRPVGMRTPWNIPAFPQASFFQDRSVLQQDFCNLTVLYTPGHSDDSVCFYEPNRGWLFAGDLLYDGPIYIERNGGLAKYRESIALVLSLDNVQRIFCSHNDFEVPIAAVHRVSKALETVATRDLETEIQVTDRLRLVPG